MVLERPLPNPPIEIGVNFRQALRELESRQPERMIPDLSRITAVAELLDNPQLTYPTIHVTGTNGKTTTTRLITRILCAHGLTTGAYTSPHLESVTERVALCDEPISEVEFGETYEHLLPVLRTVDASGERVTYFETLTALAYLWFAEKPVNAAVFEVGMGGQWDATNLIRASVCVFCEIGLDHPELGSTIDEIAAEKAGILKPGSIAVIEDPDPAALPVIESRVKEVGGTALVNGTHYSVQSEQAVGGHRFAVRTPTSEYGDLFLPLHGTFQVANAATAIAAADAFLGRLDESTLRKVVAGFTAPGRMEVVGRHPLVVLDGAHNPAAALALAHTLPEEFVWDRLLVVIGISANKDVDGVVRALAPLGPTVFATRHTSPRAADLAAVAEACRAAGLAADEFDSVPEALAAALEEAEEGDLILVTGSLYTVADARRALPIIG